LFWTVVFLQTSRLSAQTIHVLIVADTNDKAVGAGVSVDVARLQTMFEQCVPPSQLQMRQIVGKHVSRQRILAAISTLASSVNDAVVFLWSGHGAHDQRGHFLHIADNTRLYRSEITDALQKQDAALHVLLTSSCNVYVPLSAEVSAPCLAKAPVQMAPLLQSLFLESRGLVDINGASEGEYGFSSTEEGTSFFNPFCSYVLDNADRKIGWDTAAAEIAREVASTFSTWFPQGYTDRNGRVQKTQTLRVWNLPEPAKGENEVEPPRVGARFGVRVWSKRGAGVRVLSVEQGSPADQTGIARGDTILSVNGTPVNAAWQMTNAVFRSSREMSIRLERAATGQTVDLNVQLRY